MGSFDLCHDLERTEVLELLGPIWADDVAILLDADDAPQHTDCGWPFVRPAGDCGHDPQSGQIKD